MKYEAVFFDYDGTVADSIADIAYAANRALREKGLPERDAAEYRAFAGKGARTLLQRAAPAGTDEAALEEMYADYVAWYAGHANDRTKPFAGVPELLSALQEAGLTLSGLSPDGRLVETVEISDEDFFVGVQFHPEFKSRPNKPHPLFMGFIGAASKR